MIRTLALAAPALLALSGCGPLTPVGCSNDVAQSTLISVIRTAVETSIVDDLRDAGGDRAISRSSIRAALADVVIKLDDIRTAREDPNSSRRFCTATLALRFPDDTVADADAARRAVGETSVADLAANNDVERAADRYSADIEFNVQPTDDGEKVFAETDADTAMIQFAKEVVAASLLRRKIETAKRTADQAAADQTAAETAALTEQRAAALESAKVDNQLAWQTIRAAWGTLDGATRKQLQPVQTAWTRKADADCRVEAAAAAIDPSDREAARLICSTRLMQERIGWLNGMRQDDAVATAAPAIAVREPVPVPADDL